MALKAAKKHLSGVTEYYTAISASYDELHGGEQLAKLTAINNVISPGKGDLMLDVGCGTCLSLDFFGCKVKGVEPAREMVLMHRKGKYFLGRNVFIGGAEDLKNFFGDGLFDFVICVTVAHHFSDVVRSFTNIRDVGSENCVFVFSLLKGSGNYDVCVGLINKLFIVFKEMDVRRDRLIFAKKTRIKKFKY
jgi:SAM-dependent methyltransferase